ncbi:FkbM family methyltransferase [Lacibacterium aquatile]|uniref:FkbM family methyltransferase n=1 Tax=Lacibacterium aquatile TaxID=1168082 RepID=A0ABW5DS06_9PROT
MLELSADNYSLTHIRRLIAVMKLRDGGDLKSAREAMDRLVTETPDLFNGLRAARDLARELGWVIEEHYQPATEGRFYRPPYNCQIPNLSVIYEHLFGQKRDGIFFETGAYDGDSFSNTSFLADLGWRGVYLEPVREFFELCRNRHRHNAGVTVLQGAAGKDFGQLTLDLAMMSTTSVPELLEEIRMLYYAQSLFANERQSAWQFPLNFVLEQQKFPQVFDLLVLDVEGSEYDALLGLDLDRWQPGVIVIELLDRHPDFARNAALVEVGVKCRELLEQRYTEIYFDPGNSIFVRS